MADRADRLIPRLFRELTAQLGLSREQAAGVVGNLAHESAGFEELQERDPVVSGSRGGYGIAQWTGPRRRQFERWAQQNNLSPESDDAQVGFLLHELQTTERAALDRLKQTSTAQEAARVVSDRYLRPGIPHMDSRLAWTDRVASTPYEATEQMATPNFRGMADMSIYDALQSYAPERNPVETARELFQDQIPAWAPTSRVERELQNRTLGEQGLSPDQQRQVTQTLAPPSPPRRPERLREPAPQNYTPVRQNELLGIMPDAYGYGPTPTPTTGPSQRNRGGPRPLSQAEQAAQISRNVLGGLPGTSPQPTTPQSPELVIPEMPRGGPVRAIPDTQMSPGSTTGGAGREPATASSSPARPLPTRLRQQIQQATTRPGDDPRFSNPEYFPPDITAGDFGAGAYTAFPSIDQPIQQAPLTTQTLGGTDPQAALGQPAWIASMYGGTAPTSQPMQALGATQQLQNYPVGQTYPLAQAPSQQPRRPNNLGSTAQKVRALHSYQERELGGRGSGSEGGGRTTAQSMRNASQSLQRAKDLGLI